MVALSDLVLDIESSIDSVDLNPVICFENQCVVADARIILSTEIYHRRPLEKEFVVSKPDSV